MATDEAVVSSSDGRSEIETLRRRVARLESELRAARALLATESGAGTAGDRLPDGRTNDERQRLEEANLALRRMAWELDEEVKHRTHALAESEAELRRKNAELQRASRMKTEFIAIAAHELRTPMTTIVGYLDLIDRGRLGEIPELLQRPLAALTRNAHRLRRLIEELLDVSRIERGRLKLLVAPSDLVAIVREAVADVLHHGGERHQRILFEEPATLPPVEADGEKLEQAMVSLIANVAKQAPDGGGIDVSLVTTRDQAVFRVRANGAGIPPALRRHVFEPFSDVVQAKHHTSMPLDSAGLGLYIAKGIVELHGGDLSLDTIEGQYAEFSLSLPLGPMREQRDDE